MWEFLIKQESGLYKPKSVAELDFIEKYYGFPESQSNPDALLGEVLPYKYNGTSVSFVNEASLTDTGTYLAYAQINATNDSVMTASADTVAQAKTDLLDAINTYGDKLVRVIHVSTDIPFQPLPGGGTTYPEATDTDMDYSNPSDDYLIMKPSQIKAMIEAGGGGGNSLNLIQNTPISPDSP